jgi:hypothetical protein
MYQSEASAAPAGMPAGALPGGGLSADILPALPRTQRGWSWWLGTIITLAVLVAVMVQLAEVDFAKVAAMVPKSPAFWLVFVLGYLAGPIGDFVIFRRLWQIPASGFMALLRKLIGNELVTGYVGDLYFYTWARQRTHMTAAPFGAVKDVAILSAMAANIITLVLMAMAYPLLGNLHLGIDPEDVMISVALVLGTSSLVLFLRRKLFSLPGQDLVYVGFVQVLRVLVSLGLTGWAWHLALPQVGVQWLLLLSALRMLVSRLPLLPNHQFVFAGLAAFLIGRDAEITNLMTMMASLTLVTHLGLGLALVGGEAVGWRRK